MHLVPTDRSWIDRGPRSAPGGLEDPICCRLGFVLASDRFLKKLFHNGIDGGIFLCRIDFHSADQFSGEMECQILALFHIMNCTAAYCGTQLVRVFLSV